MTRNKISTKSFKEQRLYDLYRRVTSSLNCALFKFYNYKFKTAILFLNIHKCKNQQRFNKFLFGTDIFQYLIFKEIIYAALQLSNIYEYSRKELSHSCFIPTVIQQKL